MPNHYPSEDEFEAIREIRAAYADANATPADAPANDNAVSTLAAIITEARSAQGDTPFFDENHAVRGIHKRTPAAVRWDSMENVILQPVPDVVAYRTVTPGAIPAGKRYTFASAVLAASKINQLGAHVFILPDDASFSLPSGELGFTKKRHGLELLRASEFAAVDDGDDVAETALRLAFAEANRAEMPSHATSHRLTRKQQREYDDSGRLAALAGAGIAAGVADLVDGLLLKALVANTLEAFSLGAVAAKGLGFDNLRAVVGTNGDAATVGTDGVLRAAGVPAILSDQIAETIIWAPSWSGVAIAPAMGLVAERLNVAGDLVLTSFVNAEQLIVDASAVWIAA